MAKLTEEDQRVNDIAANIMGKRRSFFKDPSDMNPMINEQTSSEFASPSPLDDLRPKRAKQEAMQPSGDNSAFGFDVPTKNGTPPTDEPSQNQRVPKQRMASKKAAKMSDDDLYGIDNDNEPDTYTPPVESKIREKRMKSFFEEYLPDMNLFNQIAGITPMYEDDHVAYTGEVPTSGVDKENPMKGGLPGLQGTAMQKVAPEAEQSDGDEEEVTLDQAIAMLKKEDYDTDLMWSDFLESKGLTVESFDSLVQMAMESDDHAEMEALINVENIFLSVMPQMLPEGVFDSIVGGVAGAAGGAAKALTKGAIKTAGSAVKDTIKGGIEGASEDGEGEDQEEDVNEGTYELRLKPKAPMAPASAPPSVSKPDVGSRMAAFTKQTSAPPMRRRGDKPTVKYDRSQLPTMQNAPKVPIDKKMGESKTWKFKTHHNPKTNAPHMPWEPGHRKLKHKMAESVEMQYEGINRLGVKYLGEKNWIAGAIKRPGALHKALGVPKNKKIPLTKEKSAAKGNSRTAKEARLALTLRKMHKK